MCNDFAVKPFALMCTDFAVTPFALMSSDFAVTLIVYKCTSREGFYKKCGDCKSSALL
jgi:hypothetical protein